jgi:hypothetical protein
VRVGEVETAGGLCVRQRKARGRDLAENRKPSVGGSISGTPCETATWGDGGRWWVRVGEVQAAGGPHVHQCEAGGRDSGQKPKTECS